ncbi:MAG: 5'-methylthioadenosine/adenosylhomocysteine nucleosidase, partial [Firmicutes bacterium]|nr:5'-methylthioadenosine/adenosylhomocysteine nucleosidase [Bacillota bacterium]
MIGIIGAMQVEVDKLIASMSVDNVSTIAGNKYYLGQLSGVKVVVVCCGIGKVNASMTASFLISNYQVSSIVNLGVAGGLSQSLKVGDIVVSSKCVQYDYQTDLVNSPTAHNLDRLGLTYLDCDTNLVNSLQSTIVKLGYNCIVGIVATGDKFVADKTISNSIATEFGAIAVEMESGAIAQVCRHVQIPFVTLRTISDSADDNAE